MYVMLKSMLWQPTEICHLSFQVILNLHGDPKDTSRKGQDPQATLPTKCNRRQLPK